jgi:hypothetical protein
LSQLEITPTPTEDEAAAIVAVLRTLDKPPQPVVVESRWKLSGRDYRGPSTSLGMTAQDTYVHDNR